uniref:Glyco_tranf_GTA_type domain containing protein n=1 Tax=Parastrongyloides trichosuri TaxID=131310 RepID=A0A0N4ZWL7_PARTI
MKEYSRLFFILAVFVSTYIIFTLQLIHVSPTKKPIIKEEGNKTKVKPNEIAIVMVNELDGNDRYKQAMDTLKCYSAHYGYSFNIINLNSFPKDTINCVYKDFMFRRHCLLSNFAQKYEKRFKYILFLDGDMGVVNPLHRIEEYLPEGEEEIIFYDRTFNYEIMAGSYIFKNSLYSRNILNFFADYEYKMPTISNGRDNVALQGVFVDLIGNTKYPDEYRRCMGIYKKYKNYEYNMIFVSCMRNILEKLSEVPKEMGYQYFDGGRIKVLKKMYKKRWARDSWLSHWRFCKDDFVLHAWKAEELAKNPAFFIPTFEFNENLCKSSKFLDAWTYNKSAKVSCEEIKKDVNEWVVGAYNTHLKDLNSSRYLPI